MNSGDGGGVRNQVIDIREVAKVCLLVGILGKDNQGGSMRQGTRGPGGTKPSDWNGITIPSIDGHRAHLRMPSAIVTVEITAQLHSTLNEWP